MKPDTLYADLKLIFKKKKKDEFSLLNFSEYTVNFIVIYCIRSELQNT